MTASSLVGLVGVVAGVAAVASPAYAHFKLNAPASVSKQDSSGGPQKSAPCGLSDSSPTADNSTPTNAVTALRTGAMITISINETVFHPGHYRVALAQTMAALPSDPPVTAGTSACGSTQIAASPTLPVVADGLLRHTSSLGSGTQTMRVQLPAGMSCTGCVLQVVQFMSDHGLNNPGGCFYHHCAIVNITPDGPEQPTPVEPEPETSDGCSTHGAAAVTPAGVALLLGLLGGVVRRRRRGDRDDHVRTE